MTASEEDVGHNIIVHLFYGKLEKNHKLLVFFEKYD